ncbi:tetratricopeptide repeat protein [Xylophilus rhododendri]|uniref:Tetratricopeptide repeat protein n=1 Tax=Xylophilus rhododendri TaxID=2697032 RepID=A0A857J233_9BURK|nr:tetratricopeptide repeat protein [Xylophilus rhododendri]QHI97142.1 tetratricopeptide repeat protein [Xylophilus rhododendri]
MNIDAVAQVLDALDTGDAHEAFAIGEQALRADPQDAALWSVCGIAARLAGRPADAEHCWRRSLALQPDARVTQHLGELLLAGGQADEALACWQDSADDGSADATCWANLGLLRLRKRQDQAAETALRHALSLDAGQTATWTNLGVLLAANKRWPEAEDAYRHALERRPDDVAALTNLGLTLEELRRHDEAEACQRRALALAPDRPEVHNHLAGVLARRQGLGGDAEAEAEFHYREALRLQPENAAHLSNLGALFFDQGRIHEAESAFRAALAQDAELASAHINLGQLLLSMGRLPEGFQHTEMRYRMRVTGSVPGFPEPPPAGAARQWTGQPLAGKRLLVWPEQGHGDQLQFCRYLALVRTLHQPAFITCACTDSLLALMHTVAGADRHIALQDAPAALPEHDYWVPMLSLPLFCGTTVGTIPGATPYLAADAADIARWAPRIPRAPLRVGLVWRGNVQHDNDADRSLDSLVTLAPLWRVPGVVFVSLQKWAGEHEARHPPGDQPLVHLGSEIESFSDSAAILAQLDLLIAVDTAACHLAGALDIPCWVMLPAFRNDWRWLRGRSDTPWYRRTRLFRQTRRGDWPSVVEEIAKALARLRGG